MKWNGKLIMLLCFASTEISALTEPVYLVDDSEVVISADIDSNRHEGMDNPSDPSSSSVSDEDLMDLSNDWVVNHLDTLSGNLDSFFVDTFFSEEIIADDVQGSRAKLSIYIRKQKNQSYEYKPGLSVKMVFPHTNERLKLLLSSEDDDGSDNSDADLVRSVEKTNYVAALRFIIKETYKWKTNIDTGIRWKIPPDPFGRLRARRFSYFSEWEMKTTQTLSYFLSEGVRSVSDLQMNYPLNINKQFRISASANYLLRDGFFNLSYGAGLYHRLSKKAALGFVAGASGDTEKDATFNSYNAGVRYRRNVWKKYVYAEISPEFIWASETDYQTTPVLVLRVESIFSK